MLLIKTILTAAFAPFFHIPLHQVHKYHRHHRPGLVVSGRTSTFGYPEEEAGRTADGGTTVRPCIALRNDSTLDHKFEVVVAGHHARMIQCDWGPASWTGRAIDITGEGVNLLGFSQSEYPTGILGTARELS